MTHKLEVYIAGLDQSQMREVMSSIEQVVVLYNGEVTGGFHEEDLEEEDLETVATDEYSSCEQLVFLGNTAIKLAHKMEELKKQISTPMPYSCYDNLLDYPDKDGTGDV